MQYPWHLSRSSVTLRNLRMVKTLRSRIWATLTVPQMKNMALGGAGGGERQASPATHSQWTASNSFPEILSAPGIPFCQHASFRGSNRNVRRLIKVAGVLISKIAALPFYSWEVDLEEGEAKSLPVPCILPFRLCGLCVLLEQLPMKLDSHRLSNRGCAVLKCKTRFQSLYY